jgi:hypothetical protein
MVEFIERRANERLRMVRPGKIFDPRLEKYLPCATCDISAGGAFVEVPDGIRFEPGDRFYIGIALTRRQALIPAKEMVEAEVVRSLPTTDGRQGVAMRFLGQDTIAAAASLLAA